MSHKNAKAVRRTLRATGDDPREVQLVPRRPITLFNLFGASRGSFLGQRNLMPTCGRAIYREAKQSLRV